MHDTPRRVQSQGKGRSGTGGRAGVCLCSERMDLPLSSLSGSAFALIEPSGN